MTSRSSFSIYHHTLPPLLCTSFLPFSSLFFPPFSILPSTKIKPNIKLNNLKILISIFPLTFFLYFSFFILLYHFLFQI
eukprot:UN04302